MELVCVKDFEQKAATLLDKNALAYFRSGAGAEVTLNLNCEAFRRLRIRPNVLRDVASVSTECKILGHKLNWPVGVAATGLQSLAHEVGEAGNARAAGEAGSVFILSLFANHSIEQVAAAAPNTCKWFQLSILKDRELTLQLLRRAEAADFKAIVVTVDMPVMGLRRSLMRNSFAMPIPFRLSNLDNVPDELANKNFRTHAELILDASLKWKDIEWLVKSTNLPVVVKGILTAQDAILAREFGCAGVIVSNHGARQLDTVPATIEALPEVVRAVGDDMVVMLDGGVRQGSDIFKALALGAKMVFIGRPALWGLACGGQQGVEDVLKILKNDLEITLALTGCKTLSDVTQNKVVHESHYAKL